MINFHNTDNILFMRTKEDNFYDLAIVDPPYGMRGNVFQIKSKELIPKGQSSARLDSSNSSIGFSFGEPPKQAYFNELFRVSKNQIVFGMQYFTQHLPSHQCVIVWDKVNGGSYFSDAEIAWTSFDSAVRLARIHNPSNKRIHPTQKPIKLYRWLLQNYAKKGQRILDTHGGSHTSAIACEIEGFSLDIVEINEEYSKKGKKLYFDFIKQKRLF